MKRLARTSVAVVALSSTLLVSGCGQSKVAASWEGHQVTVAEVDSAVKEVNAAFTPTKPFTAQQALTMFIRAPYILDYAQKHGFAATESAARAAYPLADPSPATLRLLQVDQASQQLSEADGIALSEQIKDLTVTVNPKYGAYDPASSSVGAATPDWIDYVATSP